MIDHRHKNLFFSFLCLSIITATLAAGLWPSWERTLNQVYWLEGGKGLHIGNRGIIFSEGLSGGSLPIHVVEIVFESHIQAHLYMPRIISFCDSRKDEKFFVGLKGENLLLGSIKPQEGIKVSKVGKNLFPYGKKRLLTLIFQDPAPIIYLDGELLPAAPIPVTPINLEKGSSYMILGNSPRGENPWVGNLYGLGIYSYVPGEEDLRINARSWLTRGYPAMEPGPSKGVLFLFDEGEGRTARDGHDKGALLRFPEKFRPLKWNFLRPPWTERSGRRQTLSDMSLNFLGFIPMGLCLSALLYHRSGSYAGSMILAMVSSLMVSLVIESIQVFMPARFSSLSDLALNGLGAAAGAFICLVIIFILRTIKWRNQDPAT
jgi:VanZ family protein